MNEPQRRIDGSTDDCSTGAQLLCFNLGTEEYGVDVLDVQEIKGWDTVTRVPYTPQYLLGVINLRGSIVPVIDLRSRFRLACAPFDSNTVVIVARVRRGHGERVVGVVVDAVTEVCDLAPGCIQAAPQLTATAGARYLRGIAAHGERLLMIVDIEALVASSFDTDGTAAMMSAAA